MQLKDALHSMLDVSKAALPIVEQVITEALADGQFSSSPQDRAAWVEKKAIELLSAKFPGAGFVIPIVVEWAVKQCSHLLAAHKG